MTDFPTNCSNCGEKWVWNKDVETPVEYNSKRKFGWWVSYYTKQVHDKATCKKIFDALPYQEQARIIEAQRKKSEEYKKSLNNADQSQAVRATEAKPSNNDITQFKFEWLKPSDIEVVQLLTRELLEIRHVIELEVKNTPYENNQAAIGQFLNLVSERLKDVKMH